MTMWTKLRVRGNSARCYAALLLIMLLSSQGPSWQHDRRVSAKGVELNVKGFTNVSI